MCVTLAFKYVEAILLCVCDIFLTSRGLDPTFFSLSKVHEIEVIRTKSQPGLLLRNKAIRVFFSFFFFVFFRFLDERIEGRAIFCKIIGDGYSGRASLGNIENEKTRYPKAYLSYCESSADLFVFPRTRDYASIDSGKSKL